MRLGFGVGGGVVVWEGVGVWRCRSGGGGVRLVTGVGAAQRHSFHFEVNTTKFKYTKTAIKKSVQTINHMEKNANFQRVF